MITLSKPTDREVINALTLFFLYAAPICLFLFYIDEGNNSFKGMFTFGHLLVLFIYISAFMLVQGLVFTVSRMFFRYTTAGVISTLGLLAFVVFLFIAVF